MSAAKRRRKPKKPKLKEIPLIRKKPSESIKGDSFFQSTPVWKFGLIDMDGKWGWEKITTKQLADALAKVKNFEKQKWSEILNATHGRDNKSKHHRVSTERVCGEAQKRLADRKLDDLQELFSLRLSAKIRIWGKLENEVFHFIWFDPEHTVCPSLKK